MRRNMTLLLDKITKELQKSKKLLEEVLDSLPNDYKNRDLEEIHTFFDDFKVILIIRVMGLMNVSRKRMLRLSLTLRWS